ncbi:Ppx/GppA phosphatase family protein [Asticcacaulis biprosthecium]|uniref:Ppx/GppA phosphatase family protein n=1 Tax=Asticcacaulis biprosthecium TaxID=76891 RepID=UPI0005906BEB|nr:Ppx/GppA phosphatase family protein [Asticcacaulis biprosthecium]
MTGAPSYVRRGTAAGRRDSAPKGGRESGIYAALDLGTNNCRLMIATFSNSQFKIVEAFSRIVRLGEGLAHSGRLHDRAMERAMKALKICAEKIEKRGAAQVRAVATQACRIARNGRDFIARVERETGLKLTIISPEEEAHLSVMGCASLLDGRDLDPIARAALVMDVGGGSTELSWVELAQGGAGEGDGSQLDAQQRTLRMSRHMPRPRHWISLPVGVVNLAERFPEPETGDPEAWFETMVDDVTQRLGNFSAADGLRPHFAAGEAYIVGTSGAITSLAGMHLGLDRYDRSQVDGLWMEHRHCRTVIDKLLQLGRSGRELEPCIGRDRADLVLAGAAILEAVQRQWPCTRLRVADRGLREGLLLSMARKKTRRRRRGRSKGPA